MKKINTKELVNLLSNAQNATLKFYSSSAIAKGTADSVKAIVTGKFELGGSYGERVNSALKAQGITEEYPLGKASWGGTPIAEGIEQYKGNVYVTLYYRGTTPIKYTARNRGRFVSGNPTKPWPGTCKKQTEMGLQDPVLTHKVKLSDVLSVTIGGVTYKVK